ncbi:hypothetical protein [Thioclava sp. GXIMD4215]|uniref:hypothetical protein n=1 Tax=Thioclava sp. GXIMD4215 TaxID=3131928 RepID=UPI00311B2085
MSRTPQVDPVDEMLHELTALRRSVENLARTSLTRNEAKQLNTELLTSAKAVLTTGKYIESTIRTELAVTAQDIRKDTQEAAGKAARDAIANSHAKSLEAARSLSKAAGEARREAWRYFGGFWVWLLSMLALGALIGALLAYGTETAKSALSVETMARYSCERSWFGGQIVNQDDGSSYCAFWIKPPSQSGN